MTVPVADHPAVNSKINSKECLTTSVTKRPAITDCLTYDGRMAVHSHQNRLTYCKSRKPAFLQLFRALPRGWQLNRSPNRRDQRKQTADAADARIRGDASQLLDQEANSASCTRRGYCLENEVLRLSVQNGALEAFAAHSYKLQLSQVSWPTQCKDKGKCDV